MVKERPRRFKYTLDADRRRSRRRLLRLRRRADHRPGLPAQEHDAQAAGGGAHKPRLSGTGTARGVATTLDEACHAVEAEYDALVARIAAAKAKGQL